MLPTLRLDGFGTQEITIVHNLSSVWFVTHADIVSAGGTKVYYMGMNFDKEIHTYLTDDYGGHPFLIRQVCSQIYRSLSSSEIPRQIQVKKEFYRDKKKELAASVSDYVDLILTILVDRYPEEYKLLQYLAAGSYDTFNHFVEEDRSWAEHLVGYGLIKKVSDKYHFRIVVEDSVRRKSLHLRVPDSVEEMWGLLSETRNAFEANLKELVRSTLKIALGTQKAKDAIISAMNKPPQKQNAEHVKYDDVFKGEIYFSDYKRVIENNWGFFKNIFHNDLPRFTSSMTTANRYRADAHAKKITNDEYGQAIAALTWLNDAIKENA